MGLGYLKIQATSGGGALPVDGAIVTVSDGDANILYEATTDESGLSPEMSLHAPDLAHTLRPDDPGPYYAVYTVEVVHPGFIMNRIEGVQIFDTIRAILPVTMLPVPSEAQTDALINRIHVPPVALLEAVPQGQGDQESERYQPAWNELTRVQRGVTVPESITVHLGAPDATARNVRVKFSDYIKNVASSEAYPTWPSAALEANIYCRISFALNRLHTGWYRSRGYDFDITGSADADQCFVEGRNIYTDISLIVDRIFNRYIRRKGRGEPFLAQFRKGATVTCPGLSQWGTVRFANEGMAPLQILKQYCPDDIEIVEGEFGSPAESYPGTVLREGNNGPDVRHIQNQLNRIRANYPLIPQVQSPNGVYGADTANAVRTFQSIFTLPQSGIVDKATWYKISQIHGSVAKLGELENGGKRIGIGAAPPKVILREGVRGGDVVHLQFLLNYIGAFYNSITPVAQDGALGKSTTTAVTEFQRLFHLTHDGVVGSVTWKMLYYIYRGIKRNIPASEASAPAYPGVLLLEGARGESIIRMQQMLDAIGGVYPAIPRIVSDGIFGPATAAAVRAFQRQFGLAPDGVVGSATWDRIESVFTNLGSALPPAAPPATPPYPGVLLRGGSRGDNVLRAQQYLGTIAGVYPSIPRIAADGIYGPVTSAAVQAFQRLFGLTPDGVIGPVTWKRIAETYRNTTMR